MATEFRNEAASIRLEALQLAQKEGCSGNDLVSRAAYLADFIERGKDAADQIHESRTSSCDTAGVGSGEVVEIAGHEWKDGPHISAGSRMAFSTPEVPEGWRRLGRQGYLVIGEKL